MKITIQVTQDDIQTGGIGGCDCPIYIAARRLLPAVPHLWVNKTNITFDPRNDHVGEDGVVELPRIATEFIELHDSYQDGKPIEFELDIPDELIPAGGAS